MNSHEVTKIRTLQIVHLKINGSLSKLKYRGRFPFVTEPVNCLKPLSSTCSSCRGPGLCWRTPTAKSCWNLVLVSVETPEPSPAPLPASCPSAVLRGVYDWFYTATGEGLQKWLKKQSCTLNLFVETVIFLECGFSLVYRVYVVAECERL